MLSDSRISAISLQAPANIAVSTAKRGEEMTDIDYDALREYQSLDVLELLQPCENLRHRSAESLLLHGTHAHNHLL